MIVTDRTQHVAMNAPVKFTTDSRLGSGRHRHQTHTRNPITRNNHLFTMHGTVDEARKMGLCLMSIGDE